MDKRKTIKCPSNHQKQLRIGARVANAPLNSGASWLKYSFGKKSIKGLGLSVGYSFVGERNTLDAATFLPSYFLLNGGANYGFKNLNLSVIVNNITNQTY